MKYVIGFVAGVVFVVGWCEAARWYWRRADIEGALAAVDEMYADGAWPTEGR